jgi:hypothetical protein
MKKIKISNFPLRKQHPEDNCIPATIANIMQYHGKKINQIEIRNIYEKFSKEQICFERIKEALDIKFSDKFIYEIKNKDADFQNFDGYLQFVNKSLDKNLPIISVMHFPTKDGYRVHMITILGIDENELLIYDGDPNIKNGPIPFSKEYLKSIIHPKFTSFLITPK